MDPSATADPGPAPYHFRFELTSEDVRASTRATWDSVGLAHPSFKGFRDSRQTWLLLAIAMAAMLAARFAGMLHASPLGSDYVVGFVVAVEVLAIRTVYLTYGRGLRRWQGKHLDEHIRSEACRYYLGETQLIVAPSGIRAVQPHDTVEQSWSGIRSVDETGGFIFLARRDGRAFIVPPRVFPGDAAARRFLADARAWLDAGGRSDDAVVRTFLASNDAPCPTCGYNLRGTPNSRCPECGLRLDAATFPGAFAHTRAERAST